MLSDKGMVAEGSNEEVVAELDILRGEMATLVKEVREFAKSLQSEGYDSRLSASEIGEILEEIINGG